MPCTKRIGTAVPLVPVVATVCDDDAGAVADGAAAGGAAGAVAGAACDGAAVGAVVAARVVGVGDPPPQAARRAESAEPESPINAPRCTNARRESRRLPTPSACHMGDAFLTLNA